MGAKVADMRKQEWPKELVDVLEEYKAVAFEWGVSDCLQFSIRCAARLVDYDLVTKMNADGRYSTEAQAYEFLASLYGGDMGNIFDGFFNRHITTSFAGRGDIGIAELNGEKICGVVDSSGRWLACKGLNSGVYFLPLKLLVAAWRVE